MAQSEKVALLSVIFFALLLLISCAVKAEDHIMAFATTLMAIVGVVGMVLSSLMFILCGVINKR